MQKCNFPDWSISGYLYEARSFASSYTVYSGNHVDFTEADLVAYMNTHECPMMMFTFPYPNMWIRFLSHHIGPDGLDDFNAYIDHLEATF